MTRNTIVTAVSLLVALAGWIFYVVESRQANEFEQQTQALSNQVTEKETRISELEQTVAKTASAEQNVRNEYAALESRGQREQEELAVANRALTEALEAAQSTLTNRVRDLETTKSGLAAMEHQLEESRESFSTTVLQLEKARDELQLSQKSFETLSQENENLKTELDGEKARRASISESLEQQRTALGDAARELELAEQDRNQVLLQLNDARSRAEKTAELEAKLEAANSEISQRTATLKEELGRVEKLESDLANLEAELDKAAAEIEARTHTLKEERSRVEQLESQLSTLDQRREELIKQLKEREETVARLHKERDEAREQVNVLRNKIEKVVKDKESEVRQIRESVTVIRMGSDIVFATGSTRLRTAGRSVLDSVAEYAMKDPDRIISLEGHTDSVPISEEKRHVFSSNWELSAARATRALRYLQDKGIAPERLRIVGYGEYQPVEDNDTEEGRRANRRLEIVLAPLESIETLATPTQ